MKKTFFIRITSTVIMAATIATLSPLKASAEWTQNDDRTWSYKEGNKVAKDGRIFQMNGIILMKVEE